MTRIPRGAAVLPAVLPPGQCHLWLVRVRRRPGWLGLLDPRERRQAQRLCDSGAADVLVTSRAVQRLVGARYLGVPPAEVEINRDCAHCDRSGEHQGRPRFRDSDLDYSVSHSDGWVLMAITRTGLVGVDIEDLASAPEPEGFARTVLTSAEREQFDRLAPAAGPRWLMGAWTRKEAAMKLTGLGLAASPRALDVSGPTVAAAEVPRWPAADVHLRAVPAPDHHVAALATTVPGMELRRFTLPRPAAGLRFHPGATLS
ncbi:4'-phosphopantetheinyl transferase superfamily protein [Actinospica durhamensis]|uniref:4'-phosphopantetheinyl transferase superfamily protein n=1 Tax=Actinospica durhamensis TaxID=1508375 RepID=A0A941ENA6_9ACTN|nr:4'-phosphopantetheinyl transferase superfamily protein [Actinospica durhamensis]MBR7833523.1 4'-phosphopantetheinyl transferase superfamily protein [Actinospica durhamensis]